MPQAAETQTAVQKQLFSPSSQLAFRPVKQPIWPDFAVKDPPPPPKVWVSDQPLAKKLPSVLKFWHSLRPADFKAGFLSVADCLGGSQTNSRRGAVFRPVSCFLARFRSPVLDVWLRSGFVARFCGAAGSPQSARQTAGPRRWIHSMPAFSIFKKSSALFFRFLKIFFSAGAAQAGRPDSLLKRAGAYSPLMPLSKRLPAMRALQSLCFWAGLPRDLPRPHEGPFFRIFGFKGIFSI